MSREERFEKFYKDILKNDLERIEYYRNEAIKEDKLRITKLILIIVMIIVLTGVFCMSFASNFEESIMFFIAIVFLGILIYMTFIHKRNTKADKYVSEFKEIIIRKMIKSVNQNLEYFPDKGIRKIDYMEANFEKFDTYMAEDLITGNINGDYKLDISEVFTESAYSNLKGETVYVPEFEGIFVDVELPKHLETVIYIKKDEKDKNILNRALNKITIQRFLNGLDVQLDSQEFEKIFDVYASDEIEAMQLLTADVMQLLVDFYNKTKIYYEISIRNNHIYIRFKLKYMFEATSLDKDELYKNYSVLDFIVDITKILFNIVNKINYI